MSFPELPKLTDIGAIPTLFPGESGGEGGGRVQKRKKIQDPPAIPLSPYTPATKQGDIKSYKQHRISAVSSHTERSTSSTQTVGMTTLAVPPPPASSTVSPAPTLTALLATVPDLKGLAMRNVNEAWDGFRKKHAGEFELLESNDMNKLDIASRLLYEWYYSPVTDEALFKDDQQKMILLKCKFAILFPQYSNIVAFAFAREMYEMAGGRDDGERFLRTRLPLVPLRHLDSVLNSIIDVQYCSVSREYTDCIQISLFGLFIDLKVGNLLGDYYLKMTDGQQAKVLGQALNLIASDFVDKLEFHDPDEKEESQEVITIIKARLSNVFKNPIFDPPDQWDKLLQAMTIYEFNSSSTRLLPYCSFVLNMSSFCTILSGVNKRKQRKIIKLTIEDITCTLDTIYSNAKKYELTRKELERSRNGSILADFRNLPIEFQKIVVGQIAKFERVSNSSDLSTSLITVAALYLNRDHFFDMLIGLKKGGFKFGQYEDPKHDYPERICAFWHSHKEHQNDPESIHESVDENIALLIKYGCEVTEGVAAVFKEFGGPSVKAALDPNRKKPRRLEF